MVKHIGVVCGYGLLKHLSAFGCEIDEHIVQTKYGKADIARVRFEKGKCSILFRHGKNHDLYPHQVNYKANAIAMKKAGVECCLLLYAMGYCKDYHLGDLVLLDDFICFYPYQTTLEKEERVRHYAVYPAFNEEWKNRIKEICKKIGVEVKEGGIAHTIPGPRFETAAEIRVIKNMGANLLSMTCGFEVPLFHELNIPIVALAIATNPGSGVGKHVPNHEEIVKMMERGMNDIAKIIYKMLD